VKKLMFAASAALALAACDGEATGADEEVSARTDRSEYVRAGTPARITVLVTNATDDDVALLPCGDAIPVALEEKRAEGWVDVGGGECALALASEPVTLRPGASMAAHAQVAAEGEFRARVAYGRGNARILFEAVTNEFTVR
jgi:hypothetical protein